MASIESPDDIGAGDGQGEQLFLHSRSVAGSVVLWTLGGCVAIGFAAVGMVVALVGQVNELSLHAMTTLPTLLGVGLLAAAWRLARTPTQVAVGSSGITLEGRYGSQRYTWDEIGWAMIWPGTLNNRRHLIVYDVQGRTLAKIGDAFDDFDLLAELVQQRIAGRGDDTSERLQMQKARRTALFVGGVGIVFLLVAAGNAWMAREDQRAAALLAEQGVTGEARILRRFLAPNGVTPRLEYEITTSQGRTATRNAEVLRPVWDALEAAETVAVVFVPDEPAINRLTMGEPQERDPTRSPLVVYGLSIAGTALAVFLLAAAMLQWCGWDIDVDSKTGKLSIKRFGTGR